MVSLTKSTPSSHSDRSDRLDVLDRLYTEQIKGARDPYLEGHASGSFTRGTEQVFEWYTNELAEPQNMLDWGCRHAPDSCLMRAENTSINIAGCDIVKPGAYSSFHEAAKLEYTQLEHEYDLPYETDSFDLAIASGVLEHVPLVCESLRELSRVIQPDGLLVISYLPNRWSIGEWKARRSETELHRPGLAHHIRVFSLRQIRYLLELYGFSIVDAGYQTHFDLLPLEPFAGTTRRLTSAAGRALKVAPVAPCLAIIAQKLSSF